VYINKFSSTLLLVAKLSHRKGSFLYSLVEHPHFVEARVHEVVGVGAKSLPFNDGAVM
jgi:hypothetical protein